MTPCNLPSRNPSDFTRYPLANGTDTEILTGTPEGVGPLTDGDEVSVTVELVGTPDEPRGHRRPISVAASRSLV